MDKYFLGIEIGGTKLQLVVGDDTGRIVDRVRLDVRREDAADGIRAQIGETIKNFLVEYRFQAAGVGFGGPVNRKTATISASHQIEGWAGFDLADWLENLLRCPVFADNDANTAALGEFRQGAGQGFETVFYVTLGSGVGGGMVVNGRIYHGAVPGESEIGHLRLDRQGTTLESQVSGWAVDGRVRDLVQQHPDSLLARLVAAADQSGAEAKFLGPALAEADPAAQQLLADVTDTLAYGLSHAVHLFHPEIVILGGGLSLLGDPLCEALDAALPKYLMDSFRPGPKVMLAQLGEDAVPIGAMALARRRLNNQEFE
jgi:glucokinase